MLKEISLDNVAPKTIKQIGVCGKVLGAFAEILSAFAEFSSQFQQGFTDFYNCCSIHQNNFREGYNKSDEAGKGINFRRYFK